MVAPNTFHYEPLPKSAYDAAINSIINCGFLHEAILNDYSFTSRSKDQIITIKMNALAFAHVTHRTPEYASITLFNAVNGQSDEDLVRFLAESSAPFHLIHRDEQFSFLANSVQNNEAKPIPIESHISYDQLEKVFSDYEVDLKPQRIIDVKQGRDTFIHPIFRNIEPLQLTLWAAEVTGSLLVEHFGAAVNELRSNIQFYHHADMPHQADEITDLAVQLLGATILADTGVLGDAVRLNNISLNELMIKAHSKFSRYFAPALLEKYLVPAENAYKILRQIRYAGFMPDMLKNLYTQAYSTNERKESGSYDTPLYLTRHIWKNIPVEYLPPKQRVMADLTCGWGSFLIAGHERFSNISDMRNLSLRSYIRGNDNYHFTARLAGLGLLLSTSEDSWHIDHGDAFEWNWLSVNQPNIIVGNPPFKADRKKFLTSEQKRFQKADNFLEYAIDHLAPNGYLAMVLPNPLQLLKHHRGFEKSF